MRFDFEDEPDAELNRWTNAIIGTAIDVHKELGPGYMEEIYENAMVIEMTARGIPVTRQVPINVLYRDQSVGHGKADFIVANLIVVELKAVETLAPIHTAQVISYLKATKLRLAILINFNVRLLREGIKRVAH